MSKVTMRDVAKHANVSVATVSHVINNTRFVKQETRDVVLASIKALDYHPDAAARSFKTGRRNLIAFIVPDIANAFFATLIEEVESVVHKAGYRLLVINTKETPEREIDNVSALASGVADGFILASTLTNYLELKRVIPGDEPVVLIDRKLPECPLDTIIVNSYDALHEGVTHLISEGHKKIGYITGLMRISTTQERLSAYTNAMREHDLYDENLIRIGDSMSQCVSSHLQSLIQEGCSALVIPNNVMATEAMQQLLSSGTRPGRDIDLLGFRDSNQAQYGLQHMHLVVQPTVTLGRTAGEQIIERLTHPELPVRQTILSASFVPRAKDPLIQKDN